MSKEITSQRRMRASLVFKALSEIAKLEIEYLKGTVLDKGKVKIKLNEVYNILTLEINQDYKLHQSSINTELIKQLRLEIIRMKELPDNSFIQREIEIIEGSNQKGKIDVPVSKVIEEFQQRYNELLKNADTIQVAYNAIYQFVEKICHKIPNLTLEQIIELDTVLDSYFNNDYKFIEETEMDRKISKFKEEAQELIDFGNSHEKSKGEGMMYILKNII